LGVVRVTHNASPQEHVAFYEMLNRSSEVDRLFGTHYVEGKKIPGAWRLHTAQSLKPRLWQAQG